MSFCERGLGLVTLYWVGPVELWIIIEQVVGDRLFFKLSNVSKAKFNTY